MNIELKYKDCNHPNIEFFTDDLDIFYQKYCKVCDSWIHFSDIYKRKVEIEDTKVEITNERNTKK